MIFELKKFYKRSPVVIVLVLTIILSIVMPIFFIHSYESYDYTTGEEIVIKGLNGLKHRKKIIKRVSGELSIETLDNALQLYKSVKDPDASYFQMENQYPGMHLLLTEAYAPIVRSGGFQLKEIENVNNFYDKNIEKVEERIGLYGTNYLSNAEKSEAIKRAKAIQKPFQIMFTDQWPILIKSLLFSYFAVLISAIIISNQLFSFEKEEGMAMILATGGRKSLLSIGYKKVLAMLTYLIVEFLIASLLVSAIVLGILGISGWNSQIQTLPQFFHTIYDLSIGQMYLNFMGIALVSILCVALFGALINAVFQQTYTSIIISALLIITPLMVRNSEHLPSTIQRFLFIQPINGVNLFSYITSYFSYPILNYRVLTSTGITIFSVVCSTVSALLSPYFFTKRIMEN